MKETTEERFDLRRFLLLGGSRIWMLLIGAVVGAALFGAFRFAKQELYGPEQLYRNDTLYAIEFTEGEQDETQLYFNDYTWNNVLDSDLIAGVAASLVDGADKAAIAAATTIPTMSDIRLFHVYVDHSDPKMADNIQNALEIALGSFSYTERGFDSISVWDRGKAEPLHEPSTILRWAVAGAFIGVLIAFFALAYHYIMDDAIRLAADAERAGAKCLGVLLSDRKNDEEEERLEKAVKQEFRGVKEVRIVDPAGTAVDEETARKVKELLPEGININSGDPEAKRLYCVEAGSVTMAELKRLMGGAREALILCDASPKLHKAYYFYGMKKKEKKTEKKQEKKA